MKRIKVVGVVIALYVGLAFSCSAPPPTLSDTGYVGTWERRGPKAASKVELFHDGKQYRFRWTMTTDDRSAEVRCNWDGECDEFVGGKKVIAHRFKLWTDEESGELMIECHSEGITPGNNVHYIDRLLVEPGGKTLVAYTIETNGTTYEEENQPRRTYNKVADEVVSPPPMAS